MFVFLFLTMMVGPPFLLNCFVVGYGGCFGEERSCQNCSNLDPPKLRLKMKKNRVNIHSFKFNPKNQNK